MRAACWGSGLDSSPLLRLACLQAGRRQHCQPRQVRKKAAVTAAAGCPAHKSRERGNVRGFLRLQQAIWQGAFLGEGSPLISAVDARKAPSSLTGTALRAAIRSLLAREGPLPPIPFPARFIGTPAPVRHEIRRGGLYRAASGPKRHVRLPPSPGPGPLPWHTLQAARQFTGTASQEPARRETACPHKIPPRTASPKNKKALPEDRQGQQDLHVTTAVGDLNKRFWKGGGIGGRETFSPKRFPSPRKHPSPP